MKVLLGMFLGLVLMTGSVFAEDRTPTISLTATGSITAQPDRGYITLAVVTKAETSAEAVADNATKMAALYKSLDDLGVEKSEIKTVSFSVQQVYKEVVIHGTTEQIGVRTKQVPDGYQVHNMVQVTVCNLDDFGKILDAAVQDGANSVGSINFGSSKETELTDIARAEAVKRVKTMASIYTEGLGVELGGVLDVSEQMNRGYNMGYMRSAALSDAVAETSVSGGSLTFTATVTVRWKLVDGSGEDGSKPLLDKAGKIFQELSK